MSQHPAESENRVTFETMTSAERIELNTLRPPDTAKDERRKGLSTEQAQQLMECWGPNKIPVHEKPLWILFGEQFVGDCNTLFISSFCQVPTPLSHASPSFVF